VEKHLPADVLRVIRSIAERVAARGGRALLVGGAVRDALLGKTPGDFDLEVFGLDAETLEASLSETHEIVSCGQSFPVFKLKGLPVDVAVPRREVSTGPGHRDFEVEAAPDLTFAEACERRDFTVNAILWDPVSAEIIDPLGGRLDLERGRLRHVSQRFAEDPLRVLRGAQFAGRFCLDPEGETLELCGRLSQDDLPIERIWGEWKKLILQTVEPGRSLRFLRDCHWIRFYPELEALIDCPQDPEWHPEGDVWTHTLHSLDAYARNRVGDEREDLVVGLAVLCHDLGKPGTTRREDGRWRSRGHDLAGEEPTRTLLQRLCPEKRLVEDVVPLVREHLRPYELYQQKASAGAIRKLALRAGRLDRLIRVAEADRGGRPPLSAAFPEGTWLREQARLLEVSRQAPQPLIRGRDLIALGYRPGPEFKRILDDCFEAQLAGRFGSREEGIAQLRQPKPENGEKD